MLTLVLIKTSCVDTAPNCFRNEFSQKVVLSDFVIEVVVKDEECLDVMCASILDGSLI